MLHAEDTKHTKSEPQTLEHVLVTDHVPAERGSISDINLASYTGFARVISREAFDYRFTDFTDLLDTIPGIQVKQSSGTGTYSSVSVRGSTSKQVNIYLDGLLLNSPNSGSANISQIPSVLIERIEAFPDFSPAQLGNANIGGAINFKSRDLHTAKPGAQLSVAQGSFGLKSAEISAWSKLDDWDVVAGLSRVDADNEFPVNGFFDTSSKNRRNDYYKQDAIFLKAGRQWERSRLSTLFQRSSSEKGLATTKNQRRDNAFATNQSWRLQGVYDYQLGALDLAHRAFITEQRDVFKDPSSTIGLGVDHVETTLKGIGLFNTLRYISDEHERILSIELRDDDIEQHNKITTGDSLSGQRRSVIAAFSDNWCLSDEWLINATLRHYWIDDAARFQLKNADSSDTINQGSANIGLKWAPSSSLTIKSNAGMLVRIPTLSEKFGSRGLVEGNPALKTEQSLTVDAGLTLRGATTEVSATAFARNLDDGITTIYDSRGIGKPQNISRSLITGIESDATLQVNPWLTLTANATLLDSENKSDIANSRDNKMPGLYHQSYGGGITAKFTNLQLQLSYQHQDDLYYEPSNRARADTKKELNAGITLHWNLLTLDLSATNLLNKNYLDLNYFPTPGRAVTATITLNL